MKLKTVLTLICFAGTAHAIPQKWQAECIGYYNIDLPSNIDVALYPIDGLINPAKGKRSYLQPEPTFGKYYGRGVQYGDNSVGDEADQAKYSLFRYMNYRSKISTKTDRAINLDEYQQTLSNIFDMAISHQYEKRKAANPEFQISEKEFRRKFENKVQKYPNGFSVSGAHDYGLHLKNAGRLYSFWTEAWLRPENKNLTVDQAMQETGPEIQSFIKRFRARELYEVPSEQGFCLPYGFIAGDSGREPHQLGVTYRLTEHPDVTIFFQTLGQAPLDGREPADNASLKDIAAWMWNSKYLFRGADKRELLPPGEQHIEMDGREGVGMFISEYYQGVPVHIFERPGEIGYKLEYHDYTNYLYMAYIKRNKEQPGLLVYVSQNGWMVKNKSPMGKGELLKIAERIVHSVKHR